MHSFSKHQLVLCEAWGDIIVPASWSLDWRGRNSKVMRLMVKATKKGDRVRHEAGFGGGMLGSGLRLGAEEGVESQRGTAQDNTNPVSLSPEFTKTSLKQPLQRLCKACPWPNQAILGLQSQPRIF